MINPHHAQREILQRCRRGDAQAFEELISEYGQALWQMCFRLVGSRDEADDLAQDVWIAAWCGIHAFRGDASVLTWMRQIAVNCVRQSYRKHRGQTDLSLAVMDDDACPAAPSDLVEHLHHRQILARIDALPESLKRPLLLALRRGMPYNEIARREGCTVAAVKMRISRARALLAGTFDDEERKGETHV